MRIGIPKERAAGERRVGLTPQAVSLLVEAGHPVYVEAGAGEGAGYADPSYLEAGAQLVYDPAEAFSRVELVAKIAPLETGELPFLNEGQVVFGFHAGLTLSSAVTKEIRQRRITLVSYEWIAEDDGERPFQSLMSEIAGSVAVLKAVQYLMSDVGGIGLAPGFVWGVPPATIVIVGCGTAGGHAVRTAVGIGASVIALDRDLGQLRELDRLYAGRVVTTMANRHALERAVRAADVLVLAVSEPVSIPLVTREMVRGMRPRSVLVDLAVASGGAAETSRPTTLDEPAFLDEGVTHLCVPNLASLVARSASRALSNVAVGYLLPVAKEGAAALRSNRALHRGMVFEEGICVNPEAAPFAERHPEVRSRVPGGNGGEIGAGRRLR